MNRRFALFLPLLFLFFQPAQAQTCGCTIAEVTSNSVSPCTVTIGTVINVATVSEFQSALNTANNSGGNVTILVADGSYQLASTTSYPYVTASNLVIRSASGNRDNVVIHGSGMGSVSPGVENGFFFVGDNITIADLTINNVGNHGIAVTGDHLLVHNVRIQDTYEQMLKGNSSGNGADSATVQCSLFEYTAGVGPNWYIGGIDVHEGDGWTVRDNVFRNIASPHTTVAEHAVHFWDNSADNTVERNTIVNCDRGIGFGLGSSGNSGGMIRNNMIYNDGTGAYNDVGIGLETSPLTEVYNNTVYIAYPNAIEYRFAATNNVAIENNLTNRAITARDGGQASLGTNLTSAQYSWFVNPPTGNLRLATSQLSVLDQGSNLVASVPDDIDQNPRPTTGNFDLGAHELVVTRLAAGLETVEVLVYPNPARECLRVETTTGEAFDVQVFDGAGRLLGSYRGTGILPIEVAEWVPGVYGVRVTVGDKVLGKRVVVW